MPYRKISSVIKLAAICLYEWELLPLNDILNCLGFHEHTFYCILALWRETGDVVKHNFGAPGRPQILHFDDIDYLLRLHQQNIVVLFSELYQLFAPLRVSSSTKEKSKEQRILLFSALVKEESPYSS